MTFTCMVCGKQSKANKWVDLGEMGKAPVAPRGWWTRNTDQHGRQSACCEEHARQFMETEAERPA